MTVASTRSPRIVQVALPVVLDRSFGYVVPESWERSPSAGTRVLVPFGPRVLFGVVRPGAGRVPAGVTCRPLLALAPSGALPEDLVRLCEWIAQYYVAPVGEAYRLALPGLMLGADARLLRLTPQGRAKLAMAEFGPLYANSKPEAAAANDEVDPEELALLGALANTGTRNTPLAKVIKGAGKVSGAYAKIEALAKRGDCELFWEDRAQDERRELHLRAVVDKIEALKSASEQEIQAVIGTSKRRRALFGDLISEAPGRWIPRSELRSRFPDLSALRKKLEEAELIETCEMPRDRDELEDPDLPTRDHPLTLNADQARALEAFVAALDPARYASFLLFGVTGSGKTEVYLQLIARALEQGRGAIVLVPEIALTPQLAGRFRARFGETVAVVHSAKTEAQRLETWQRLRDGRCKIAVGARSAIFAPVPRLGVVIVDEEHDGSFKQDEGLRYHARDVALVRAQHAGAVVVLGSATPSLESLKLVQTGRHALLELPERVTPKPLPEVELLSLVRHRPSPETLMSARLKTQVQATVEAGEQAILFLNRRGFTTMLRCQACGESPSCPDCSSSALTFHRQKNRWICHLCGYLCDPRSTCPSCRAPKLAHLNAGTERVEAAIQDELAPIRVLRLDRDTSRGRNLNDVLRRFREREADVLVGTQMLSKGHDFPGVTLVGVLCADQGLGLPDPRASERVFSLLTQVAGRAGRGERPGRVIVQAWSIETHPLPYVQRHDYRGFSQHELELRRELGNPPWGHLALVRVSGPSAALVRKRILALDAVAAELPSAQRGAVERLGPVPSPMERINRRVRWQLLLRSAQRSTLREILVALRPLLGIVGQKDEQTLATVDVDPHHLM